MDILSGVVAGVHARGRRRAEFSDVHGELAANGHCKLVDIERTFGVTGISVKRAVKQYRNGGGCRAFFQARRGRGPGVLTPSKVSALQALLDDGLSYRQAARQEAVKADTVRKGIARGLLRATKKLGRHLSLEHPWARSR